MPQYRPRAIPVIAIPLPGPLAYQKWGGSQTAKAGDYLVQKAGDVYTIAKNIFEATYLDMPDGTFVKRSDSVDVEFALVSGVLPTLEGTTAYNVGDAILTGPAGDRWALSREKLDTLYEAV